jgi:hypothetical protein
MSEHVNGFFLFAYNLSKSNNSFGTGLKTVCFRYHKKNIEKQDAQVENKHFFLNSFFGGKTLMPQQ